MLDDVCLRPGACADQEDYDTLTRKTLSFLRAAVAAWDAEYFVKVRPDEFWLHNGGAAPRITSSELSHQMRSREKTAYDCRWMMMYICDCST